MPSWYDCSRIDQFIHALGLFEIGAEFGLEGDVGQIVHAIGKGSFLIGIPEEAGVVEAGAQDAFIAVWIRPSGSPSVLVTATNCGASLPSGVSTEKYFWWCRITVMRTSLGRSRNSGSKVPVIGVGHSVRLTSVSRRSLSHLYFVGTA